MNSTSLDRTIAAALAEDIGTVDITTRLLVPSQASSQAFIQAKQKGIICGLTVAQEVFHKLDPKLAFKPNVKEGTLVKPGQKVARLHGKTRAILTGERVALNFLSHLSGIATATSRFVHSIRPYRAKVYDTRKTTPGLRSLERLAVRAGGGHNHRFDLSEMVLVKDNHHAVCEMGKDIAQMTRFLRQRTAKPICIEVTDLRQMQAALAAGGDIILLDNMSVAQMQRAVQLSQQTNRRKRPLLEASGGVDLHNVRAIARTGVDRISIGALTHSVSAIDFSLEIIS